MVILSTVHIFWLQFYFIFCSNKSWKRYILCTRLRWGEIGEVMWRGRFLPNLKRKGELISKKGWYIKSVKISKLYNSSIPGKHVFWGAMLFWYFRGRNLALIMAGNLTVLCSKGFYSMDLMVSCLILTQVVLQTFSTFIVKANLVSIL